MTDDRNYNETKTFQSLLIDLDQVKLHIDASRGYLFRLVLMLWRNDPFDNFIQEGATH